LTNKNNFFYFPTKRQLIYNAISEVIECTTNMQ